MDILEIRKNVSLFPELIIVRMRHHLVPELDRKAELFAISFTRILQSSHFEIKLVTVLRAEIESLHIVVARCRRWPRLAKPCKESKVLREKEGAVVMHVVTMKPI